MTRRIAILISGRGSNMSALIDAVATGRLPAEVSLVISNRADAAGLNRAAEAGIPTAVVSHRGRSRDAFESQLQARLEAAGIDLVCLAGFMRILSDRFVARWEGRMLNIHPSLLPAFRGLHVHEQALEAGVALSGCTVHWVTAELDSGPIVGQAAVPVLPGDTPETLAHRVNEAEHRLYPEALRQVLGLPPQSNPAEEVLISLRS